MLLYQLPYVLKQPRTKKVEKVASQLRQHYLSHHWAPFQPPPKLLQLHHPIPLWSPPMGACYPCLSSLSHLQQHPLPHLLLQGRATAPSSLLFGLRAWHKLCTPSTLMLPSMERRRWHGKKCLRCWKSRVFLSGVQQTRSRRCRPCWPISR